MHVCLRLSVHRPGEVAVEGTPLREMMHQGNRKGLSSSAQQEENAEMGTKRGMKRGMKRGSGDRQCNVASPLDVLATDSGADSPRIQDTPRRDRKRGDACSYPPPHSQEEKSRDGTEQASVSKHAAHSILGTRDEYAAG